MSSHRVAGLLSDAVAEAVLQVAALCFFAAAMVVYDVVLASVAIPIAFANLIALLLTVSRRAAIARRLAQDRGQLAAATVGVLRTIETIKSVGLEPDAFSRWAGYHAKTIGDEQQLQRQVAALGAVPPLVAALSNVAILGVGAMRIIHGTISVGELVAFQTLAASFFQPLNGLVSFGATLHSDRR